MTDLKQMSGVMNLDNNEDVLPPLHHKYLMNGRFRGSNGNLRLENIPGNILIPNYLLPTGTNQQNGGFYDSVKRRIIWWNYNSNGRNGIYKYDVGTKTLSKIFICFTDSATDILNLSLDHPIHSASIVYRSDGDGDLLFWAQGNERPKFINIDTVAAMQPFTQDMINVAKNVPLTPVISAYHDDLTVNVNNLRKKLFRFAYRWVYKNLETSTISTISKVPIPVSGYDPDIDNDPTKNNYISVPVFAGGNDTKAIEILMQVNGLSDSDEPVDQWGDFQSVVTLDMAQYNIAPGGSYTFNFYNNSIYPTIDLLDAILYYDRVPDIAQTMDVLNGNHIIYGNITDGYPSLTRSQIDVTLTTGVATPNIPSISFLYTGGSGALITIGPVITTGVIYHIEFDYISGGVPGSSTLNYATLPGATPDTVAIAIAAALNAGVVQASPNSPGLVNITILGVSPTISNVVVNTNAAGVENAAPSFKCPVRYGIQYLDQWDKPVGGVYSFVSDSALDTTDFSAVTPDFTTSGNVPLVPFVAATISHLPPVGAVCYHWVRAELTPKFIYWVTNDYQTDTNFLYICIQNLYYQNSQSTGFVPTYDFSKGDRVRVVASYDTGTSIYTPYSIQLDFEILGVVQRTMTSPASAGTFLKVTKPTTFPSAPYQAKMLVEIYTPKQIVPNDVLVFKECGEKYDIYTLGGVRYHRGQTSDQTASQPATFQWFDGDVYYKNRTFYVNVNSAVQSSSFMMDANYNDYWNSAVNSNGRGWLINPDARVITNEVAIGWGLGYLQDTNINQLNRFRPENTDVLDLSKGPIRRILSEERVVYMYHSRAVGSVGIYSRYIKNNEGQQELISTDELITKNNIYYLKGNYGLQNQPSALFRGDDGVHYFIDCTSGDQLRRSGDGITNLGELYFGQYTISDLITPYNSLYLRPDGSKAKILGFFDYFEGEAHFILQGGTYAGKTIENYNLYFNEKRNGYTGFDDIHPEWALQAASETYAWKNGQLYIQNDEIKRCNFFGVQHYTSIILVFNKDVNIKKTFDALAYQGNQHWTAETLGDIITSQPNPQTNLPQISSLKQFDFDIQEGLYYAGLKRDANSMADARLALCEGDFLKGTWCKVKLTYKGNDYAFLYLPYIKYSVSQRNN